MQQHIHLEIFFKGNRINNIKLDTVMSNVNKSKIENPIKGYINKESGEELSPMNPSELRMYKK